jgi:uncharacterized tellurite resistance protein B-like protein
MEQSEKLLKDFSDPEKGAYLGAIASIATADREATTEEVEFIRALAESADLSDNQEKGVMQAARELSGEELKRCLDILKDSDLRFSLIADIISFASADGKYSPDEKENVEQIAQYLDIDEKQFSLLDLFVKKTNASGKSGEEVTKPGFLESLGFGDKFKNAGINSGSLTKGLLGILGPLFIARMFSGGRSGNRSRVNQGLLGRFGSGFNPASQGGVGSLISMLKGGRGYTSLKSFFPKLFGSHVNSKGFVNQ